MLAVVALAPAACGSNDGGQTSTNGDFCAVVADYGSLTFDSGEDAREGLLATLRALQEVLPQGSPSGLAQSLSGAVDELEGAVVGADQSVTEFIDSLGADSSVLVFANDFYRYAEDECGDAPAPAGFEFRQF